MNLKPLFELQKKLDEHIVKEKGLEGQDLLPKKILALQVELGELANEWRGFKFWSEDQEPRTKHNVFKNGIKFIAKGDIDNPLLEEYVDCLHFILSIGLEIQYTFDEVIPRKRYKDIQTEIQFMYVFDDAMDVWKSYRFKQKVDSNNNDYKISLKILLREFIALGEMLGFTWEQIEQAYRNKNKVNHERQSNGY